MEGSDPPPLDAGRIVGLLADDDRRRAVAAVQLGARKLDDVAVAAAISVQRAAKALSHLAAAGLVVPGGDGGLEIVETAFRDAARAALARPPSDEHGDEPAETRRVLDAFVRGGRLVGIPSARSKRLVVLNWLAQDFEPGQRYTEAMVNLILGRRHADTAALRRYLVDEEMLERDKGEYWRSGGSVPVDEP